MVERIIMVVDLIDSVLTGKIKGGIIISEKVRILPIYETIISQGGIIEPGITSIHAFGP